MMKIVTFNLRSGGTTKPGNQWQRLMHDFVPDIVCAQETRHPNDYSFEEANSNNLHRIVHELAPHGKWGSAIYSKTCELEQIRVQGFDGYVVGARINDFLISGSIHPVTIFSIHVPTSQSYSVAFNQILTEIAKAWDMGPLILAGDFNLTMAIRHKSEYEDVLLKYSNDETNILNRLRMDFGLFNAWQIIHPNENLPQTLRWSQNPKTPYHCDAIFLSNAFLPSLVDAKVEDKGHWNEMSDHNPIQVTLK